MSAKKINVIWSKERKTPNNLKAGTGDHSSHCCRLCGGCGSLRGLRGSYVREGAEETFATLVQDCFGVQVIHADCFICEDCIKKLWETRKLKSLVMAAFDRSSSDCTVNMNVKQKSSKTNKLVRKENKDDVKSKDNKNKLKRTQSKLPAKVDVSTLTFNMPFYENAAQRETEINSEHQKPTIRPNLKRIHIPCGVCKHTFPMLYRYSSSYANNFVCTRCKKQMAVVSKGGKVPAAKQTKTVNNAELQQKGSLPWPKQTRGNNNLVIYVPVK